MIDAPCARLARREVFGRTVLVPSFSLSLGILTCFKMIYFFFSAQFLDASGQLVDSTVRCWIPS